VPGRGALSISGVERRGEAVEESGDLLAGTEDRDKKSPGTRECHAGEPGGEIPQGHPTLADHRLADCAKDAGQGIGLFWSVMTNGGLNFEIFSKFSPETDR
jgi:hypothetical protein